MRCAICLLILLAFGFISPQASTHAATSGTALTQVGNVPSVAGVFAVADGIAYVGQSGGLQLIDIHDPANPAVLTTITLATPGYPGGYAYPDEVTSVFIRDGRAYVTSKFLPTLCCQSGTIRVIDVRVPARPVILGALTSFDPTSSIVVAGDYAYVGCSRWLDNDTTLRTVDIHDPAQLTFTSRITGEPLYGDNKVAVAGDTLYLADAEPDLVLYDISDPATPALQKTVSIPAVYQVLVSSSRLYLLSGQAGLLIYDITIPTEPRLLGRYSGARGAVDMQVDGDTVVFATNVGIDVLDVGDPTQPLAVAHYPTAQATTALVMSDALVLASTRANEVDIFQLSTPAPITGTVDAGLPTFAPTSQLTVSFASSSLSNSLDLTYATPIGEGILGNGVLIGGLLFELSGRSAGSTPAFEPTAPYTITLDMDQLKLIAATETLGLRRWDGTAWVEQPTRYDVAKGQLVATASQFGRFAWFGQAPTQVLLPFVSSQ